MVHASYISPTYASALEPSRLKIEDVKWKKLQQGGVVGTNELISKTPVCVDPKKLIRDALTSKVHSIDHESCMPGEEDAFFVADLGEVYRQHMRWQLNLPRVKPFYAVKANPNHQVLRLLAGLGSGFDCASKGEIEQVLRLGVQPDRIIYAQPCKTNSYVRYVQSVGVKRMTFDNADELFKVARLFPDAQLLLRIMTDDTSSQCRLSMKFGATLDSTDNLLSVAKSLKLNVVGVSFHVGSGATDPLAYHKAVCDALVVFQHARAYDFAMHVLDIGGGFCNDTFDGMASVLTSVLDEYFPSDSGVSIIAEPGRFYVSTAFTIACHIIARRTVEYASMNGKSFMLYVNDGIYGNFSCILFDHQNPAVKILKTANRILYEHSQGQPCAPGEGIEYSVWGPTCDGIDRIAASVRFRSELDVGDWLYCENMGAYTSASASKFNGFSIDHSIIYVCSEPNAKKLLGM